MAVIVSAQEPVQVVKAVDSMTGEYFYTQNRKLVSVDREEGKGLAIGVFINNDGQIIKDLMVKAVGIGDCMEKDKLILQLADGTLITKTSWKNFNCEGTAYFNLTPADISNLRHSKLVKVRITNGRTYDSYTGTITGKDCEYFQDLLQSMESGNIKEEKF